MKVVDVNEAYTLNNFSNTILFFKKMHKIIFYLHVKWVVFFIHWNKIEVRLINVSVDLITVPPGHNRYHSPRLMKLCSDLTLHDFQNTRTYSTDELLMPLRNIVR